MRRDGFGQPLVELGHVRHAAAKHDHVRIEDVDDYRQAPRQAVDVAVERGCGRPIARTRLLDDRRGGRCAPRRSARDRPRARALRGRAPSSPACRTNRSLAATHPRRARAGACGPIRPRRGFAPRSAGRARRCRRRSRNPVWRQTPRPPPRRRHRRLPIAPGSWRHSRAAAAGPAPPPGRRESAGRSNRGCWRCGSGRSWPRPSPVCRRRSIPSRPPAARPRPPARGRRQSRCRSRRGCPRVCAPGSGPPRPARRPRSSYRPKSTPMRIMARRRRALGRSRAGAPANRRRPGAARARWARARRAAGRHSSGSGAPPAPPRPTESRLIRRSSTNAAGARVRSASAATAAPFRPAVEQAVGSRARACPSSRCLGSRA